MTLDIIVIFLDKIPKASFMREITENLNIIKMKNFL